MAEIRTIRYDDGRWCEQQYVDGKLNGTWTVYYANGQKEWERQHKKDRTEGYFRRWDEAGRLIEEQWYHLNELHGCWRKWDVAGREEIVGDFYFGYPRQTFGRTPNTDFNTLIKPNYELEPVDFAGRIASFLQGAPTKDHPDEKGHAAVTRPFRAWLLLESCERPWCRGRLALFQGRSPLSNPSDQLRRRESHG